MELIREQWTEKEYKEFVEYLKANQDMPYREFHKKLVPGVEESLIGIRVPHMWKMAKQIAKGNAEGFLKAAGQMYYYEEKMIKGMVIASLRMNSGKTTDKTGKTTEKSIASDKKSLGNKVDSIQDILGYMKEFVSLIDNWGVCDTFCAGMKITKKYKKEMWDFILPYWNSEHEFEARTAIVMTMDYYIEPEYLDTIFKLCDSVTSDLYYINMAQAWLLSVCFVKYEEETMAYLKNNQLSEFTYQKTLQKIIESNRVSKEKKQLIREMKKENHAVL